MKLNKLKTPPAEYVVASRNGVRLSKPSEGLGAGNAEGPGAEQDVEGMEVAHDLVEGPNSMADAEYG